MRDLLNFSRLIVFGNQLPQIRAHVALQLRRRTHDRDRILAAMLRIIDSSAMRIGSEEYAEDNESFELTTLTRRHVRGVGARIESSFPAKSGNRARLSVSDRRVARVIEHLQQQRSRRLFTFDGQAVDADEINALLVQLTGEHITAKDFRTWNGTLAAFTYLTNQRGTHREPTRKAIEAVDRAAEFLGNTRAIARAHYMHPQLLGSVTDHTFEEYLASSRPRRSEFLSDAESAQLAFLHVLVEREFDRGGLASAAARADRRDAVRAV